MEKYFALNFTVRDVYCRESGDKCSGPCLSVCRLATQQIDTFIRIQQSKQQDVRTFTPLRYAPRYGSTVYSLFAVVRSHRAIFVYSNSASSL